MSSEEVLTVSGYFENLATISDFVTDQAVQAGLDDRAIYAVQMAVDEACSNIIEHAYGSEGAGDIRIVCQPQPTGLQITIYDHGSTDFDPSQLPEVDIEAPLSERKSGGMGMFFIRKLMDRVIFTAHTPQGNQLILFKQRTD